MTISVVLAGCSAGGGAGQSTSAPSAVDGESTSTTPVGDAGTTGTPTAPGDATPRGSPSRAATPTASPAPGLRATATASTLFDTQRTFRLELSAVGPDVHVTSLRLDSPYYEKVGPVARDVVVPDGGLRLVPLPYGAAVCPATTPDVEGVLGQLVVDTPDGRRLVPVDDRPVGLVAGRHAHECAVAAANEAVALAFGETWSEADPRAVTGVLTVAPDAGVEVEVLGVEGNIVFTLDAREELPVGVGDTGADIGVRVAAARCDTHALIEAKKKFHHVVTLAVDGGEPVAVEVEATGATRELFQGLVEACLDDPE